MERNILFMYLILECNYQVITFKVGFVYFIL